MSLALCASCRQENESTRSVESSATSDDNNNTVQLIFDPTGMYYWCPPRSLDHVLLVISHSLFHFVLYKCDRSQPKFWLFHLSKLKALCCRLINCVIYQCWVNSGFTTDDSCQVLTLGLPPLVVLLSHSSVNSLPGNASLTISFGNSVYLPTINCRSDCA